MNAEAFEKSLVKWITPSYGVLAHRHARDQDFCLFKQPSVLLIVAVLMFSLCYSNAWVLL